MIRNFGHNAIIGQSGGPTSVINASLCGAITNALQSSQIETLYGMQNGIDGLLGEKLHNLSEIFQQKKEIKLLSQTPGAALGSCRTKLPPPTDKNFYERLFSLLEKYKIGYFFYIGGNDSMDTVNKISAYAAANEIDIKVIGIPKTIDNDLCETDHTPGFGSAAKFVATTIAEIRRDTAVYEQKSVTIVEIMGRDAGWLTASAALAGSGKDSGADLIYLPEAPFKLDSFYADIAKKWTTHSDILVAVSEGIRDENGAYIGANTEKKDKFGHVTLSGAAKILEEFVKEKFGCKVRSIELNTPQRCAAHIASLTDIKEAFGAGKFAVKAATKGKTGVMIGISRLSESPYSTVFKAVNVADVANRVKPVPRDFINENANNVTEECLNYLRPLIQGEHVVAYSGGIPQHFVLPKL